MAQYTTEKRVHHKKDGSTYLANKRIRVDKDSGDNSDELRRNQDLSSEFSAVQEEEEIFESDNSDANVDEQGRVRFKGLDRKSPGKDENGNRIPSQMEKAVIDEIKAGIKGITEDPEELKEFLDFATQNYNYSFKNQVLLKIQKPNGKYFKTMKQWGAMGYKVKKGSFAAFVRRPIFKDVEVLDKNGNPILDENGNPKKESRFSGTSFYPVFSDEDIDQSENPLPEHPLAAHVNRYRNNPDIPDSQAMREDLLRVAESENIEVSFLNQDDDPSLNKDTGGYATKDPSTGQLKIVINASNAQHAQTSTLAHEMGHIMAGHLSDEENRNYGKHDPRSSMETEAEMVSYIISSQYGLQSSEKSFAYIKAWAGDDESKIDDSMDKVSTAVEKIQNRITKLIGAETPDEEKERLNAEVQKKSKERKAAKSTKGKGRGRGRGRGRKSSK